MSFFKIQLNRYHLIFSIILSIVNIYLVTSLDPPNKAQGVFGNIFYIHVPVAWTAFLIYFAVMIAGVIFLIKKESIWDDIGYSCAEVGTLFMFMVLTTGPIWAKPAWGYFWPWEPRLTTSLILFLIYIGYFMLREFGGSSEQVPRYAAILGIVAFIDVPLIFYSVKFWLPELQSHTQVGQYFDENNSLPTYLILFSFFSFIVVSSFMIRFRIHILRHTSEAS